MFMFKNHFTDAPVLFQMLASKCLSVPPKKPRYNSNRFPVREISVAAAATTTKATDRGCSGEQWCHEFGECKSNLHRRLLWNAAWELTKSLWPPFCHILCCENTVTLYNARVAESAHTHIRRWWQWKHTDTHTHHVKESGSLWHAKIEIFFI